MGTRILITGACGSIGEELVRQLQCITGSEVVGLDIQGDAVEAMRARYRSSAPAVQIMQGDVRSLDSLFPAMAGIDLVIHAAALKDVPECESSPLAAIETNVQGTHNVLSVAAASGVKRVILLSSDKAANPSNVMGATKLIAERMLSTPLDSVRGRGPICHAVRLGNVLGSAGSVIPVWRGQLDAGLPLTVTDPEMTRFVMTIEAAADFVISTREFSTGGEVLVPRLPTLRIGDLADVLLSHRMPDAGRAATANTVVTGIRPGEKMHEELMTEDEVPRTAVWERGYVIRPTSSHIAGGAGRGQEARLFSTGASIRSDRGERMDHAQITQVLSSSSALLDLVS